jgi:hypothetical protein
VGRHATEESIGLEDSVDFPEVSEEGFVVTLLPKVLHDIISVDLIEDIISKWESKLDISQDICTTPGIHIKGNEMLPSVWLPSGGDSSQPGVSAPKK